MAVTTSTLRKPYRAVKLTQMYGKCMGRCMGRCIEVRENHASPDIDCENARAKVRPLNHQHDLFRIKVYDVRFGLSRSRHIQVIKPQYLRPEVQAGEPKFIIRQR